MSDNKDRSTQDVHAPQRDSSRMKTIAVVTVIALALGLFGGWAIAAASNSSAQGDVWVIGAQGSEATADTIVLTNPAPTIVGVTLDGERTANSTEISKVVQQWDTVFGDTTPRAILAGTSAAGAHSVVVELGTPTATADSLTFPATPLDGAEIPEFVAGDSTLVVDGSGVLEAGDIEALTGLDG